MAVDKTESGAVQAGGDSSKTKKTKKPAAPKMNTIEKAVAEAKAAYKDLDLSEGRSLRKRAAAPSAGPKKTPAKKAATAKKPAAAKKAAPAKAAPAKKGKGAKAAAEDGDANKEAASDKE